LQPGSLHVKLLLAWLPFPSKLMRSVAGVDPDWSVLGVSVLLLA
jgi:hypothetical protein